MSGQLNNTLKMLSGNVGTLSSMQRGLEKEGLRVAANGIIAQSDHPAGLGSALSHPAITTDYSEALLELITRVHKDPGKLLQNINELHAFVHSELPEDEVLWAGSMPCRLAGEESVRIADYGPSNPGRLKHIYRVGLANRYGRIMQCIAGVHYNFSLADRFWKVYGQLPDISKQQASSQASINSPELMQQIRTGGYFALIRNFRRWSWLLMYLFGASPVLDQSFLNGKPHRLEKLADDTYGLPFATSLRMSDLGYQNNAQASLKICFNYLHTYTRTLFNATHTPYPSYESIGILNNGIYQQLNTNLLQIENEYYNTIRPKRVTLPGEKPLQALDRRGVEYIEVRCLDLNPYFAAGVDIEQLTFMDAFLLTCMLAESPLISDEECVMVDNNFAAVVENGRSPDCRLSFIHHNEIKTDSVVASAQPILDKMHQVAEQLDLDAESHRHRSALVAMQQRLLDPSLTPSARVLEDVMKNNSYENWMLQISQSHKNYYLSNPLPEDLLMKLQQQSTSSRAAAAKLLKDDQRPFTEYLQDFLADSEQRA